jgi:hypothetical protein
MVRKLCVAVILAFLAFALCQCAPRTYVLPARVQSVSSDAYVLELEPGVFWVVQYVGTLGGSYTYQPGDSIRVEVQRNNAQLELVRILDNPADATR